MGIIQKKRWVFLLIHALVIIISYSFSLGHSVANMLQYYSYFMTFAMNLISRCTFPLRPVCSSASLSISASHTFCSCSLRCIIRSLKGKLHSPAKASSQYRCTSVHSEPGLLAGFMDKTLERWTARSTRGMCEEQWLLQTCTFLFWNPASET